jgi:uncharacterized protein
VTLGLSSARCVTFVRNTEEGRPFHSPPGEVVMAEASNRPKGKRGFASMSPEQRRVIASKGGKSIPDERRAFSRRKDLTSDAGRKGGLVSGRNRLRG